MEIIDFHTHPFPDRAHNICGHAEYCGMSAENTPEVFRQLGISKICGAVIRTTHPDETDMLQKIRENNDAAIELKRRYGDFYIPGFHVHPAYVEESIQEIHRMHEAGFTMVGELVPYSDGWAETGYGAEAFSILLDEIEKYDMVVSLHPTGEDDMDNMVREHKNIRFVIAHPGEYKELMRHIDRIRKNDNCSLDISGYGVFRYGMLRRAIDSVGVERILFGSDFPTCSPAMYLGAVTLDRLISDREREYILSLNAKRLLKL